MKNVLKILCVTLLLTPGLALAADTIEFDFTPTDDAFVDDSLADSNFGDAATLATQGTGVNGAVIPGQPDSVQQSYLQFDVSDLLTDVPAGATIESVVFGVYLYGTAEFSAEPSVDLFYAEDTWNESTVTWNNAPEEVGDTLGTQMNLDVSGYYEWDLLNNTEVSWVDTDIWKDGAISFLLAPTIDEFWNGAYFFSSEARENQPYLRVTYSVVPAPGSITLAVVGLSSLMAIRRKKRNL